MTADRYDEVLPERATAECAGGEECRECVDGRVVAKAGYYIEVLCPDPDCPLCEGGGFLPRWVGPGAPKGDLPCTVRVRLTEDPTQTTIPEPGNYRHRMGWRHVGTVMQ